MAAFPVLVGGWILLSFTQRQICSEGWGGLALWLQLWLTAGDVVGTRINKHNPRQLQFA